jgi:arabinose-5-phosphate isomerase
MKDVAHKQSSVTTTATFSDIINDLLHVLTKEAEAIARVAQALPSSAVDLVQKILNTRGKIVFSGGGKSGIIARKLAATFSSVGIPSFFLHPGDALHGDLGMVRPHDLFVALSKSGTGSEIAQIFQVLKSQGNEVCLICCNAGALADSANLVVMLPFEGEACHMNLAPTSSSTLMVAFGDAVAIAASKQLGFGKNDFAKFHPAGALGRRLTLTVRSLMHGPNEIPFVPLTASFKDLLYEISFKKFGLGIVVDEQATLLGVVTDGDLRRSCERGPSVFECTTAEIMTKNPKTVSPGMLAYDALKMMEDFNITSLIVIDNEQVVGVVHIHDLIKAGFRS